MPDEPIYVTRPSMPPLAEYAAELEDVWAARIFTNSGPKHEQLTRELESYLDVGHVSLFANGHLALEAAIQTLGITGEVITTPFTFASTTHAIVRSGASPVFGDIDPRTFVLDPAQIESLITEKTTAILPVHVYGNLCDHDAIASIAREHGLKVIYDAAHAFGVVDGNRSAGSFGDISMFSFHATKVFNTIEGGGLTFADPELAEPLAAWRQFGQIAGGDVEMAGSNAKMSEPSAAMGLCNLRRVDADIARRQVICERYRERLDGVNGLTLNAEPTGVRQNFAYFPVLFDPVDFGASRDQVSDVLAQHNIFARKYFSPLTSQFPAYGDRFLNFSTPIAQRVADQVLVLPLYPDLALDDVERICDVILGTRSR